MCRRCRSIADRVEEQQRERNKFQENWSRKTPINPSSDTLAVSGRKDMASIVRELADDNEDEYESCGTQTLAEGTKMCRRNGRGWRNLGSSVS